MFPQRKKSSYHVLFGLAFRSWVPGRQNEIWAELRLVVDFYILLPFFFKLQFKFVEGTFVTLDRTGTALQV